jgi:hypothetical protein
MAETLASLAKQYHNEFRSWRKAKERVRSIAYHTPAQVLRRQPNWRSYYRKSWNLYFEPSWMDGAEGFKKFLAHIGPIPSSIREQTDKPSLDRIDSRLGYVPGNVRWATPKMQVLNRECTTHVAPVSDPEQIMSAREAAILAGQCETYFSPGSARQRAAKRGETEADAVAHLTAKLAKHGFTLVRIGSEY